MYIMKKRLFVILTATCLTFSLAACGNKSNPQPTTPQTNVEQTNDASKENEKETKKKEVILDKETIDKAAEVEQKTLQENNQSLLDTGHYIVKEGFDTTSDTQDLTQYAYIKNDNLTFINKEYVVYQLYAIDKEDNEYTYMFFEEDENKNLADYISGFYINAKQEDETLELLSNIDIEQVIINELPVNVQKYSYGNDVVKHNIYGVSIPLEEKEDGNVYFVCIYNTTNDNALEYSELFNACLAGVNLQYK